MIAPFNKTIIRFYLLIIFSLLFEQSKADSLKEVVVLNSYHTGFKWTEDINHAIADYFYTDQSVRLFCEYMDSKRFHSEAYLNTLKDQYYLKFHDHKVDGIICSDNHAFDFFLKYGKEIWGDVPAVFCGVNNIKDQLHLVDTSRHAIVYELIDVGGTIDIIEELHPGLEEIIVVSDETLSGKIFVDQFVSAFEKLERQYTYTVINNTNPQDLRETLLSIPNENRAIYLLSLYTERNGIPNEMFQESHYFFDGVNIPIYSNWDFLFPHLIVGGKILKAAEQGQLSAQIMDQMLNNKTFEIHNYPNDHIIIDYTLIERFNLELGNLSLQPEVINQQESYIKVYKRELSIILIILIVFTSILILLIADIIKRKRIEIDYIDSEKRLELAIRGANEGLWDIDLENENAYVSEHFARLLGYTTAVELNFSFSNWHEIVLPVDLDQVKEAYNAHKEGGAEAFRCEARLIKKDKSAAWFSVHGKITESSNGVPTRVTGIILNINNQKAFEGELKKAKERAEESDRLKSSFLANMSHEIRTPMNAILGFTDLLIYSQLNPEERNEYLGLIKRSGENLLTLINDIIDISKIESGELKIVEDKIDVHEMVKEVQSVAISLCNNLDKSLEIKIKQASTSPLHVFSDPLRIYQILLNLVSNAVKFTEKGSVVISYKLSEDDKLLISVKDTGPGIPDKDKSIIFDRFRQIDESSIKKHGGTGLGLSITKSLVELMEGQIEVKSCQPHGSEFMISIPVNVYQANRIASE
ncbi:MAG: ATP-binding protein [Carboxylicivirga sp.]|jgi:PAS domain S-box-containing protein|nr:ATP-binding protein [Carboxylicivirga sp.]